MKQILKRFSKNVKGRSSVEYGLLISLVAIGIIIALSQLGASTSNIIQLATDAFDKAAADTNASSQP